VIDILITTYNRVELLKQTVEACRAKQEDPYRLFISTIARAMGRLTISAG
jgi:hypothetical protein